MNIEVVEAYLLKSSNEGYPKGWSLHVYFPEWEMDIRGFKLYKNSTGWFLKMPYLHNYDVEEKRMVGYPVISFLEKEKTKGFVDEIKEKGIKFVEKKIANEMAEKEKKFKEKKKRNPNEKF